MIDQNKPLNFQDDDEPMDFEDEEFMDDKIEDELYNSITKMVPVLTQPMMVNGIFAQKMVIQ